MYLYFSPKSIIFFIILAVISYIMGGFSGLLWFSLISLAIGGISLIYDYVENKIKYRKKEKSNIKSVTIKPKRKHNFKVINGGKSN